MIRVDERGRLVAAVPRAGIRAVQMPQAFRLAPLREAHAAGGAATDDATLLVERHALVLSVPGDVANLHVTTPAELDLARAFLLART